jgi:hypothetical protein
MSEKISGIHVVQFKYKNNNLDLETVMPNN